MRKEDRFQTIATKLSSSNRKKFVYIANSFGMSPYELLQALILSFFRYFDKESKISEETYILLKAFENVLNANRNTFNPLSMKCQKEMAIEKAIVFVKSKADGHLQTVEIGKSSNGEVTECYNVDVMLTDFLQSCDPQILDKLEKKRKDMGYFSINQILHEAIENYTNKKEDAIEKEIRLMFDDIRIPTGEAICDDIYYKRKPNRGYNSQAPTRKKNINVDVLENNFK